MQGDILTKIEETINNRFDQFEVKFNDQLTEFRESLKFFSDKIDDYEKQVTEFKTTVKTLEASQKNLESENIVLKRDLGQVHAQLESLQQYNRNRNLQVDGVPETNEEAMDKIAGRLAEIIGEPIDFFQDIQAMHRIPTNKQNGIKPIIIQFSNRQKRDAVLKKSKSAAKKKVLNTTDFVQGIPKTNVYVNEHLTPFYKNLLFNAKKLKEEGYKYIWVSEGKIFVRKSENEKKIKISNLSDLTKLGLKLDEPK